MSTQWPTLDKWIPTHKWVGPRGDNEAMVVSGSAFIREWDQPRMTYRIPAAELERRISFDAENLIYRINNPQPKEPEPFDIGDYAGEESPMVRGKIRKTLSKNMVYRGKVMSRKAIVELIVSEGAYPNHETTRIWWNDGRFLDLGKTASDYACYLVGMKG